MSRRTGIPVSYLDEREPRVTPDGMTWIDQDGNPPDVDKEGRLRAPFTTVDRFRTERWGAGTLLPLTPAANAALAAAAAVRLAATSKGAAQLRGIMLDAAADLTGSDTRALPGNSPKEDDMSAAGTKAATKSHTRAVPKPSAKKGRASKGVVTKAVKQAVVGPEVKVVSGNGEHPTTDHLDKAKREGVRVASASRGGFHVIVFGTLNRALKGVFEKAEQAKAAAVAAGLDVKGMPK